MNQKYEPALEPNNQVLAPPFDGGDTLTVELRLDASWILRPDEARVAYLDAHELAADERRRKLAPDGLDLG